MNSFPYILGIMDTLNDWNDKLNSIFEGKGDNVLVGALIAGAALLVGIWGINTLNKK